MELQFAAATVAPCARRGAPAGQKENSNMRGTALVVLAFGGAVLFGIGCGKDEAPPAPAATAAADPNSTGVAECDSYLKQMTDCYANTPQAAAMADSTNKLREKLKADVAAQGKDAVKTQCNEHIALLAKNPLCAKK
jgi:hypothetical protein